MMNSVLSEVDTIYFQKQPSRDVLKKRCSGNMQEIYGRTHMPKCNFTLRHGHSSVNLLHIFRTPRPTTLESSHFLNDFMLFHTQILCYFMPFWSEFYAILCHFGVNFKLFHALGPIRR